MSSARCLDDATGQSSVTTSTPQKPHVGIIVGACLGAAGALLFVGLLLFRLHLRRRRSTETAEVQHCPQSWARRSQFRCHGVVIVASHQSRSIDLGGANTDTSSVGPASDETSDTKQWNKSTEVLDISLENAPQSPLPPLPLPEPGPIDSSDPVPILFIRTNVQADVSPPSSHSSTPTGPSHSSVRPLPTPPTGAQARQHRSPKAEEAHRESGNRRPSRRKISADDVRAAYVHQHFTAHPKNSMCCEADGCGTLHHHDGGMNDFPPPYSES